MATLLEKANLIKEEKDEKILPENIKHGVTIFGITGTYTGDAPEPVTKRFENVTISKFGVKADIVLTKRDGVENIIDVLTTFENTGYNTEVLQNVTATVQYSDGHSENLTLCDDTYVRSKGSGRYITTISQVWSDSIDTITNITYISCESNPSIQVFGDRYTNIANVKADIILYPQTPGFETQLVLYNSGSDTVNVDLGTYRLMVGAMEETTDITNIIEDALVPNQDVFSLKFRYMNVNIYDIMGVANTIQLTTK